MGQEGRDRREGAEGKRGEAEEGGRSLCFDAAG